MATRRSHPIIRLAGVSGALLTLALPSAAAGEEAATRPAATAPAATAPAATAPAATAPAATAPAATPPAPELDLTPLPEWYAANAARISFNAAAPAEDLSLAVNLIDWIVNRDPAVWKRMESRIERYYRDQNLQFKVPVAASDRAEAARIHGAARALTGRIRAERDGAAEEAAFGKALLLDPGNADYYNHLAIASNLRKQFDQAVAFAKIAVAVDPGFLKAFQELAYAYKNAAQYEEAIAVVDRGVQLDGDLHTKALLFARKGQAHWMLSQEEAARKAFKTSRRLGGPSWTGSYLDGEQTLGENFQEAKKPE